MKFVILAFIFALSCTFANAGQKHLQKKKPEPCESVMERAKTAYKHELFVGFARKEALGKVRKDFPDLRTHKIPAFKTCIKGATYTEGPIQNLLMITIKDTPTNVKRLHVYSIKNAG